MYIKWAYAPAEFSVQTKAYGDSNNPNGSVWETAVGWQPSISNTNAQWWHKQFYWYRWRYRSFTHRINFDVPTWAYHIRILMRNPVNWFFGIYRVEAWSKQWVVMLKSGQKSENESCLTLNDGYGNAGNHMRSADCLKSIATGDGRDLWIV
jgi:hypothetical protein